MITIPLTVKLRWSGEAEAGESNATLEIARMAEGEGLAALTLHARTPAQGYAGEACWDWIARLKAAVTIPVIGNGDIRRPAEALAMIRQTGCDGVMIGRALIGDPWLLRDCLAAIQSGNSTSERRAPAWDERRALILHHAALMQERYGRKAFVMFRKHAVAYLRGLTGVRRLRDQLMTVTSLEAMASVLAQEPDPGDHTTLTINTDEHEARLRRRGPCSV